MRRPTKDIISMVVHQQDIAQQTGPFERRLVSDGIAQTGRAAAETTTVRIIIRSRLRKYSKGKIMQ
jgi:hypothetical protein